jgi:hypothetical protein
VNADALFAACAAIAKQISAQREAERKRKKEARSAKSKARYAAKKAAGTLPKRKLKAALEPEPDYDPPTSCYCQHTAPPCGWCTDPERTEEDYA